MGEPNDIEIVEEVQKPEGLAQGDEDPEVVCPLCQDIFVNPLTTPCGHTFCSLCKLRLFTIRIPGEAWTPVDRRRRPCPICRDPLTYQDFTPAAELNDLTQASYPAQYAKRAAEVRAAEERIATAPQPEILSLKYGNRHRAVSAGSRSSHEWDFYVTLGSPELDARFIQSVTVHLHPTFRPARVHMEHPPFSVRRLGWGVFIIRADVILKPGWDVERISLAWNLQFTYGDRCRELPVDLEPQASGAGRTLREAGPVMDIGGMLAPELDWRAVLAGVIHENETSSDDDDDWEPAVGMVDDDESEEARVLALYHEEEGDEVEGGENGDRGD